MVYECPCYGSFEETGGMTEGVPLCRHERDAEARAEARAAERRAQALALIPPSPRQRKRPDHTK